MSSYLLITFFPIDSMGGGERWVTQACAALKAKGLKVELYHVRSAMNARRFEQLDATDEMPKATGWVLDEATFAHYAQRFDVIWVHQYMHGREVLYFLHTVANKQIWLTNHGDEQFDFFAYYVPLRNHRFLEVSKYSAERSAMWDVKAQAVYGGIWAKDMEPVKMKSKKARSISMCGRILPHKKFEVAIEAIEPGQTLSIVGAAQEQEMYLEKLKRIAQGKQVTFCGRLPDEERKEIIRQSKAFVACSSVMFNGKRRDNAELFGLVIVEAVALGTLPVVSDLPSFVEIMEMLELQELVYERDNSEALAQKLAIIEGMPAGEYQSKVEKAQKILVEKISWDSLCERLKKYENTHR